MPQSILNVLTTDLLMNVQFSQANRIFLISVTMRLSYSLIAPCIVRIRERSMEWGQNELLM